MKDLNNFLFGSILSLGILASPSLAQQQLQAVTGTNIRLIPPAEFTASERFSGYQHEASNSSILVTEIPASIEQLRPSLTDSEKLQEKGMTLLNQKTVTINEQEALLLNIQQSAYGTDFKKWILLLGNDSESVLVTATFLAELEAQYSELLKDSLLTVEWNQAAASTDDLAFVLSETADLKLAQKIGNALAYTKNGVFPAVSTNDPIFIVAPSLSPQYQDVATLAQNRLFQTDNLTEIEIISEQEITVDSLTGYEIVAVGKDIKSGEERSLYQVILVDSDNYYYVMQGQVDAEQNQQYLSQFKELASSFDLK